MSAMGDLFAKYEAVEMTLRERIAALEAELEQLPPLAAACDCGDSCQDRGAMCSACASELFDEVTKQRAELAQIKEASRRLEFDRDALDARCAELAQRKPSAVELVWWLYSWAKLGDDGRSTTTRMLWLVAASGTSEESGAALAALEALGEKT